ncbi:hypothetical protein TGMAS_264890 [Toxoplasma gondii MAS]|uniref:Uncharacterized protein n=1 Tax=Toxoplasma gondii MAS TaxID=943118 RepID=A0A086PYX8_TOXGO|nr:hypothetical protein TGMAS_264890 [Toxoplasma gondii MAS]
MYPPPPSPLSGRAAAPPEPAPPPQGFLPQGPSAFPPPPAYFSSEPRPPSVSLRTPQVGGFPFSPQAQFSTYAPARPLPAGDLHERSGGRVTFSSAAAFQTCPNPPVSHRLSATASSARLHAVNILRSGAERDCRPSGTLRLSQTAGGDGLSGEEAVELGNFSGLRQPETGGPGLDALRLSESADPLSRSSNAYDTRPGPQIHAHPTPPFAASFSASAQLNSASFNAASFNAASFNSASFNSASFNSASFNSASFNSSSFASSFSAATACAGAGGGFVAERGAEPGPLSQVYVQGKNVYGGASQATQRRAGGEAESLADRREPASQAHLPQPPADGLFVPRSASAHADYHFPGVRTAHGGDDIPPPPGCPEVAPPGLGASFSQRMHCASAEAAAAAAVSVSRPLSGPRPEGGEKADTEREEDLPCFYDSARDPRAMYGARSRREGDGGEAVQAAFPVSAGKRSFDLRTTEEVGDRRLPSSAVKIDGDPGSSREAHAKKDWRPLDLLSLQLEPTERSDDALQSPLLPDIDSLCDPYANSSPFSLDGSTPVDSADEAGLGPDSLEKRTNRDRSLLAEKARLGEGERPEKQTQRDRSRRLYSCVDPLQAVWRLPLERFNPLLLIPRIICEAEGWLPGTTRLAAYGLPPDLSASMLCELLLNLFFTAAGVSGASASLASAAPAPLAASVGEDPTADDVGFLSLYDPLLPPSSLPPSARSSLVDSKQERDEGGVWRLAHAQSKRGVSATSLGSAFSPRFASPKKPDFFVGPRPAEKPLASHAEAVGLESVERVSFRDDASEKFPLSDDLVSPLFPALICHPGAAFARPAGRQASRGPGRDEEKPKAPTDLGARVDSELLTNWKRQGGRELGTHALDLLRSQRKVDSETRDAPAMALLTFATEHDAKRFWLVFSTGACQAYGYTVLLSPDPSGLGVYTEALASSVALPELRARVEALGPFPLQRQAGVSKPASPSAALPFSVPRPLRPSVSSVAAVSSSVSSSVSAASCAKPIVAECPLVSSESLALARDAAVALNAACRWHEKSQKCELLFPSEEALLLPCVALHTFPPASQGLPVTALLLAVPVQRLSSSSSSSSPSSFSPPGPEEGDAKSGEKVEVRLLPVAVRDLCRKKDTGAGSSLLALAPLGSSRGPGKAAALAGLGGSPGHLAKAAPRQDEPLEEPLNAAAAVPGSAVSGKGAKETPVSSETVGVAGSPKPAVASGDGDAAGGAEKRTPGEGPKAGGPLGERRSEERQTGKGEEKGKQVSALARGVKPPPVVAQRSNVCAAKKRPGAPAGTSGLASRGVGSGPSGLEKGASVSEEVKSKEERQGKTPTPAPVGGLSLPSASPGPASVARTGSAGIRAPAAKSAIGRGFVGTPQTPEGATQRGGASLGALAGKGEGPKGPKGASEGSKGASEGPVGRVGSSREERGEEQRRGGSVKKDYKRGRTRRRVLSESESSSESSESSDSSNSSDSSSSDPSSSEDEDSRNEEKRPDVPIKRHRLVRRQREEQTEQEGGEADAEKEKGKDETKERRGGSEDNEGKEAKEGKEERVQERLETGGLQRSASLCLAAKDEDAGPQPALLAEAETGDVQDDRSAQGSEEEKVGGRGKRRRGGAPGRGRKRGRGRRDDAAKATTPQPPPKVEAKRRGRSGRRASPSGLVAAEGQAPEGEDEALTSASGASFSQEKGASFIETPLLPADVRLCFSPARSTSGNATASPPSRSFPSERIPRDSGGVGDSSCGGGGSSPGAKTPVDGVREEGGGRQSETPVSLAPSGRGRGKRRRSEGNPPPRRSVRLRGETSSPPFLRVSQAPSFPAVLASPPSVSSPVSVGRGVEADLLEDRGRGPVGSDSPFAVSLFVDGEGEASPGGGLSAAASDSRRDPAGGDEDGDRRGDSHPASGAAVEPNTPGRLADRAAAEEVDAAESPPKRKGKNLRV